jgi:hypothetical protein
MVITSTILGLADANLYSTSYNFYLIEHFNLKPRSSLPGFNDFCLVKRALRSFLGKALTEYLA